MENGIFPFGPEKPCSFYYNNNSRQMIFFDKATGDFITSLKMRTGTFNKMQLKEEEFMSYNKTWYLKLLTERQKRPLNKAKSYELSGYSGLLSSHLDWEIRDSYLELLEEFLEKKKVVLVV
jgi:hypothetical protein